MKNENNRIPERGPFVFKVNENGASLYSDDFNHDVTLSIHGDFGSSQARAGYAAFLADVLTRGCARAQARQELEDNGILASLEKAAEGPTGELLQMAADEISRLRVALAQAQAILDSAEIASYFAKKAAKAQQPSAFAVALEQALKQKN